MELISVPLESLFFNFASISLASVIRPDKARRGVAPGVRDRLATNLGHFGLAGNGRSVYRLAHYFRAIIK